MLKRKLIFEFPRVCIKFFMRGWTGSTPALRKFEKLKTKIGTYII